MPEIALPAFHITATRKIVVEAGHELTQDLERYRAFYRQAYGADVAEADLLREMARRFMEADRDFQSFKSGIKPRSRRRVRLSRNEPSDAPTPQAEGTGEPR
jgi:hypothetical protein